MRCLGYQPACMPNSMKEVGLLLFICVSLVNRFKRHRLMGRDVFSSGRNEYVMRCCVT